MMALAVVRQEGRNGNRFPFPPLALVAPAAEQENDSGVVVPRDGWRSALRLGCWAQLQYPLPYDNLEIRDAMRQPDYAFQTCARRGCKVRVADREELCTKHARGKEMIGT